MARCDNFVSCAHYLYTVNGLIFININSCYFCYNYHNVCDSDLSLTILLLFFAMIIHTEGLWQSE